MEQSNVSEMFGRGPINDELTAFLKESAQKLLQQAVEAEAQTLLDEMADRRTDNGRRAVVRNGHLPEREVQTGIGPLKVKIPKVRSKDGTPVSFQSNLVPPYVRKTKSLEAALPWLYLKGVSTGEMSEALSVLVGPEAKGLSASTVSRLKKGWSEEYKNWSKRDLSTDKWVYIWTDGIYSGLRGEDNKLCVLVVLGVNEQGEKRFLAIEDGVRESKQSWKEVLNGLKVRGMEAPELAIGDGALGAWGAMGEVFPKTRHQRCWMHKTSNVLNYLPKATQPKAKAALHDIWQAESKDLADKAFDKFLAMFKDKYKKATDCLEKDRDVLLSFYDFPAKHWQSVRTTNPIESAFGTIRHRTRAAKGCVSRDSMLHMIFKLGMCAERNWRRLRGFNYLAKVIRGVKFKDGIEIEESTKSAA